MNKKVTIISIIILIILCITFCRMSLDDSNDTFYLIKLGESISKNGIDMLDHFSWIPNLPYTYPHWLYSLFIFFVYNNFGFTGVYLSTLLMFIILIMLLYYVIRIICNDRILALIATAISIVPLSSFAQPRAQLVSIILILIEVLLINKLIVRGKKQYIVYLAICSLIMANVHATAWIVFFVFFLPFFGEQLVFLYSKWKNKVFTFNGRLSFSKVDNIKLLIIAFLICFLMGLLSPSRICYTYFFKISLGNSQKMIIEHFPLELIKNPLIIFLCFILFFSKSKIKVSEFLMICGITLMSLMAQRHTLFFYTIGILYFSIILKRNIDEKKDLTFNILESKIVSHISIPILVIIILLGFCYVRVEYNFEKGFIDEEKYPVGAVKYIKDNLDYKNIKIINNYNHGSYLLFNDIKVFFDSRCDLYFKEFNKQNLDVFDDYFNYLSPKKEYDYDQLLQKYGADFFLFDTQSDVYYIMKADSRYTEVYADENFGLFQKKYS